MKINYPLLKIKIKHFFYLETEAEKAAIEDAFIRSQKERMEHIQNYVSIKFIFLMIRSMPTHSKCQMDLIILAKIFQNLVHHSVNFGMNCGKL